MNTKTLLLLSILATAAITDANAEPRLPCPNCSAAEMASLAGDAGPGSKYVHDFPGSVIRRYSVSCASSPDNPSECFSTPQVTETSVASDVSAEFALVRQVWAETFGSFTKQFEVDYGNTGFVWHGMGDHGPSAYTLVADFNFRAMFSDHLGRDGVRFASGLEYLAAHASYINQMIQAYAGQLDGLTIVFLVRFPDGTSATFEWKYGETSARYVPTSARTPGGQGIPEDLGAGGVGYWHSTHERDDDSLERMVRFLQSRGVQVTRGDSTRVRTISCTFDGRTLTCSTT